MKLLVRPLLALAVAALSAPAACEHPSSDASSNASAASSDQSARFDGDAGAHKAKHNKVAQVATVESAGTATPSATFAINQPTPDPMPPPALRKPKALPTLPTLPSKDTYPKEAKLPDPPETGSCGQVWTGTEYIGVDCVSPDVHAKHSKAAKVVVAYDKLKQPMDKLPKIVDHRFDGTEGPIRKQGGIECSAFAFTAALDHAYARWTGSPGEFSVMQVWGRYHKPSESAGTAANLGDLLSAESEWPYDKDVSRSWNECSKDPAKKQPGCGHASGRSEARVAREKKALAEIPQIEVIKNPDFDLLREKLAAGQDATVGLHLHSFAIAGDAGAKYIIGQSDNAGDGKWMNHEVLLCGYAMTPNGNYYLVHNSWGPRWGDAGYAWLHEDILKMGWIGQSIAIPDVEPLVIARERPPAHRIAGKCDGEKVPDSISGLCAGRCPDGGPRHNDVCAEEKKECPAGQINLTGECVLSAPKTSGSEGAIKWECAPSGCTYEVAKGDLDCNEKECQVSCPAPDFRLASAGKELVCV